INNNGTSVTATIWKNVNGVVTQLASAPVTTVGGIGTLRFEVASDSLKLYYGASAGSMNLVAFANDRALTAPGSAGMRSTTGNVTLDNFAATAISLATPALGFSDTFMQADGTQLSTSWVNQAGNFADAGNTMVANPA